MKKKVAIIGGGIGGLTLAKELVSRDISVDVYEKGKNLGGLLAGFPLGKSQLELAYHHIFKSDSEVLSLIKELGLEKKTLWIESSIGIHDGKRVQPFMGAMDLLRFKGLDIVSKIRLGLVALWLGFDNKWEKYEKVSAAEWMEKYCGKKGYEVIWRPLLEGKFNKEYKKVSMAWLWARIHTRSSSKERNGKEYLGYIKGGFENLVAKMEKDLRKKGVKFFLGKEVEIKEIEKKYDRVIYTGALSEVDYLGALGIIFESEESLSPYYWHNINDLESPFLAFIQQTNLIDKKEYRNKHVYYMGSYLSQDDKRFEMKESELYNLYFDYLKKLFPSFERRKVSFKKIFKFKTAQHLVKMGYKVPKSKMSEKVYRMNFAQIYPEDRGINFAVREGRKMAKTIRDSFES